VFDMGLDAAGLPAHPAVSSRCTLAPVQPTRLALVPGSNAQVYVADGAGDGVVSIATASIPPPPGGPCTMQRISAGGRSVRSVALSPRWFDAQGTTHPPGEILMMVLEPQDTAQPGIDLDPGGVLFAGTGLGSVPEGIVPIPPFGLAETGQPKEEPMQPLSLAGLGFLREGAFLRAVQPQPSPRPPDFTICTAAPCTPLYVGQPGNAPTHLFELLAVVTATDGGTYFIEVPLRRFVNQNTYALPGDAQIVPIIETFPAFGPVTPQIPVLTINTNAFEPGLTRRGAWRAVFHSPIPGIDRRGGTVTPTGHGTLLFTSQADLPLFQNDPAIALAVGDVVSFGAYTLGSDTSAACTQVVNDENPRPYRFELPIVAIPDASTLELAELPDNGSILGFHPDGCSSFGAVAEVRVAGTQPWLVFEGATVRGRVLPDGNFTAHERRFDYPRTVYDRNNPPIAANDVAFTFAITGATPTIPRSFFSWSIGSGQILHSYFDTSVGGGFATAVFPYSSPRHQSLVFTAVTGGNEILQADPSVLISSATGVLAYR